MDNLEARYDVLSQVQHGRTDNVIADVPTEGIKSITKDLCWYRTTWRLVTSL